ncbi:FAD-binding oxidoreductase [Verrucomicrobium spinosum]|uniref:NAD(P)/FAD-dependent oxidoreductase n=1 Tax=Verrucomicrobium spinosum TaxID=2736 RepID=UPI0031B5BA4B
MDAYRLTHTLLQAACQRAARVHDRTGLAGYEVQGNNVIATTERGSTIRARHIVFATGYEAQGDLDQKIVSLHSSFALVSEPVAGRGPIWHEDCLIWEHADPYLYLRTTEDRRIIIGGEDEDFRDADRRDALIESKSATLLRKFRRLFPSVPFEVAFAWAGTFGETKDGLPYIGQTPEFPRASFTLGFGGNGIIYSLIAAEIVRDEILGKKNEHAELFRFGR